LLEAHEREKKKKHLKACLEQHRHFSPFVASTDGLLGKESQTLHKKLSTLLPEKWEKPYSKICGYVNTRMSIAMVRATPLPLFMGLSNPNESNEQLPASAQREDKAGLGLIQRYNTSD
jgi:hypothetical protein